MRAAAALPTKTITSKTIPKPPPQKQKNKGLLLATPETVNTAAKWGRLWLHESERVYADRLVCAAVRLWFVVLLLLCVCCCCFM